MFYEEKATLKCNQNTRCSLFKNLLFQYLVPPHILVLKNPKIPEIKVKFNSKKSIFQGQLLRHPGTISRLAKQLERF